MEAVASLFEPNYATRFNLASTIYSTAGHNRTKSSIWWGVSSTNATTRDLVLEYNYEKRCFGIHSGINANYFASVGDANGFFQAWSGDYSGNIYQHESGYLDDAAAIDWYFTTPHLGMGDPYGWKHGGHLMVAGDKQTSGTLSVDVFVDRSTTASKTLTVDMTAERFQTGSVVPLGVRFKTLQLKFRNAETSVPTHLDSFGIYFTDTGPQV
jgi:hypothetical protein